MKGKKLSLVLAFFFCAFSVFAQDRSQEKSKYRGFVELGHSFALKSYYSTSQGGDISATTMMVSTSHGTQVSPCFFVGAGIGVHSFYKEKFDKVIVPLFLDIKGNFFSKKDSPFINVKFGYHFGEDKGLYFVPSIGYCIYTGSQKENTLNIKCGYQLINRENKTTWPSHSNKDQKMGAIVVSLGYGF